MIGRLLGGTTHLHDDELFEGYLAERCGEPLAPSVAEHLAQCPACYARQVELTDLFGGLRSEGDAETDEIFTTERLDHQRAQVLRRVERMMHPAHVISFPSRASVMVPHGRLLKIAPRWLAAAAAAGLFVGIVVGSRLWTRDARPSSAMTVAGSAAGRNSAAPTALLVASPASVVDAADDDVFLDELEFALERTHTRELQPFDALTPRVQEIGSLVP